MNSRKEHESFPETETETKEYGLLKWSPECVIPQPKKEKVGGGGLVCEDTSGSEDESAESDGGLAELLNTLRNRGETPQLSTQSVSSDPATREDVIKLAEQLDEALRENCARDTGICDVRRSIYAELFDELIREEGVVCVERGGLLVRMRDEMRRGLGSYQHLYVSSTAYGIRKDLEAEEVKKQLENEIEDLKLTLDKSRNELAYLTEKYDITEKQYEEMSKLNEEKHQSVMEFFNDNNQILKEKLVSFLLAKK